MNVYVDTITNAMLERFRERVTPEALDDEEALRALLHYTINGDQLGVIGRARSWMQRLAKELHHDVHHPRSKLYERRRGYAFEVQLNDNDGPTGFIARVEVTLDRFEDPSPAARRE